MRLYCWYFSCHWPKLSWKFTIFTKITSYFNFGSGCTSRNQNTNHAKSIRYFTIHIVPIFEEICTKRRLVPAKLSTRVLLARPHTGMTSGAVRCFLLLAASVSPNPWCPVARHPRCGYVVVRASLLAESLPWRHAACACYAAVGRCL